MVIPAAFGSKVNVDLIETGSGKLVRQFVDLSGSAQVDLSALNPGLYSVRFTTDAIISTSKLTILK